MTEHELIVVRQGPKRCGLYRPGHEIHPIHGLKAGNDREPDRLPAKVIEVESDGMLTIDLGDGNWRWFWNHAPQALTAAVEASPSGIELDRRWHLLRVPSGTNSTRVFSLGDPVHHEPCPAEPPAGDPVDLARRSGGFFVSGDEARAWAAQHRRPGDRR